MIVVCSLCDACLGCCCFPVDGWLVLFYAPGLFRHAENHLKDGHAADAGDEDGPAGPEDHGQDAREHRGWDGFVRWRGFVWWTCAVLLVVAFAFAFVDRFARLLHVRPATGGDDTVALAPSTHRNAPRSAPLAPRSMLRARVVRIASYDVSCNDDDTGW
jgi:hypothetical protein